MSTEPGPNLVRLGTALQPFEEAELVTLFRTRGSTEKIKAALAEVAAPDLVTLMIGGDVEHSFTGTFHGPDGFIEAWRDYSATFSELRNELTDFVDVSPDVVYVESRQMGTTATAGVDVDYEAAAVFRFAGGMLQQAEFHLDREAAKRAAGLASGEAGD